jgi:hypothetical protein
MNGWMNERHLEDRETFEMERGTVHGHCAEGGKEGRVSRRSVRNLQLYLIAGMKKQQGNERALSKTKGQGIIAARSVVEAHLKDESERTDILLLIEVYQWPLGHSEKSGVN